MFLKGFVPRGKDTLTSRLLILERVKSELDKQLVDVKNNKKNISSDITQQDYDYDDDLTEFDLLEDLRNSFDVCAFSATYTEQCLTNKQVYELLHDQSDLINFSPAIEQQIMKPHGQICTSIDLSLFFLINE